MGNTQTVYPVLPILNTEIITENFTEPFTPADEAASEYLISLLHTMKRQTDSRGRSIGELERWNTFILQHDPAYSNRHKRPNQAAYQGYVTLHGLAVFILQYNTTVLVYNAGARPLDKYAALNAKLRRARDMWPWYGFPSSYIDSRRVHGRDNWRHWRNTRTLRQYIRSVYPTTGLQWVHGR